MGTLLITLGVFVLLMAVGIVISVRLYTSGALITGRLRRIRRVRAVPGGPVIEEVIEEEAPAEEET